MFQFKIIIEKKVSLLYQKTRKGFISEKGHRLVIGRHMYSSSNILFIYYQVLSNSRSLKQTQAYIEFILKVE